jgi:hypothetical protein
LVLPRYDGSPALAADTADITVLVYAHADNDLDGFVAGPGDLNEMVKQADKVNFVVFHDRAVGKEEFDAPHLDLPIGYTGGYVFRVGSDGKAKELKSLGEPYTMEPQTLAWFIFYGLTSYPARSNLLVLNDHGGGPNGYFGSPELDTPTDDPKSTAGPISLTDATTAIRGGIDAAVKKGWKGGVNGKRFDAIIHATCLNGNYEIYRELSAVSKFVWGSEEVTYGDSEIGFVDVDYSAQPPIANSPTPALSYLKSLVAKSGDTNRFIGNYAIASAIFDLDKIGTVTTALKQFVDEVKRNDGYRFLAEARVAAIAFGNENGTPNRVLALYDLGDLIARIPPSAPRDLISARNALYASIESARLTLSVDGPYKGARGLSIYFPGRREGVDLSYQNLPDPTGWTRLIRDAKLAGTTSIGEVALAVDLTASAWKATLKSQRTFPGSTEGAFILGKDVGNGEVQASSTVLATVGAGGPNQAQAVGTLFEFFLGTSLVTANFSRDLSSLVFDAYLVRANTGQQSKVRVSQPASYKSGKWTFGIPSFRQEVNGAFATLTPSSSDLIAPLVKYYAVKSLNKDNEPILPILGFREIPQRGVPSLTSLVAVPVATGTKLSLIVNLWTDNYGTEGDLVIEQAQISKQ